MLSDAQILQEFKDAHAILSGHFILSSGLRSPNYIQCARVLVDTSRAERLCQTLAAKVIHYMEANDMLVDAVVAPAMGGVLVGYEMGRQLGLPTMFCERVEGKFQLRRGFELEPEARVLVVEDVVTTGKSSMEAVQCIRENGGNAVLACSLIDRRGGNDTELALPLISLLALQVPTYKPEELPLELAVIPAIKPGSRGMKRD